ncbi:MAG TPA: flagellar basal body rod protein FlgB [Xanthobacteraceae bacterium]|jgi:flagellar basal-body rod protein FlgB
MSVTDLPLFAMLKHRMYWLEERQRLLAENVANADTPSYRGRDLKQLDFHEVLKATNTVKVAATAPGHITGGGMGEATRFATDNRGGFETTPRGNAVVLEDEMMKVAQNQMDHQAVTALYSRGLGLLKTALGRK